MSRTRFFNKTYINK